MEKRGELIESCLNESKFVQMGNNLSNWVKFDKMITVGKQKYFLVKLGHTWLKWVTTFYDL